MRLDAGPLRIAMVGLKGLPATYGGVERHVEEIGSRLSRRGHEVTVYCRPSYHGAVGGDYRGMRLCAVPTVATKHLDAIVHSALSTATAMREAPDIIHYHALGPGLVAPLARCRPATRVVLTVHGLDNQRAKWGRGAQAVLGTAHWMSGHVPHATVVVSRELGQHYAERFSRPTHVIPNGAEAHDRVDANVIRSRFGLAPGSYVLFVGRLVPEKLPDLLVRAFRHVPGPTRLVVAGGSSFTDDYERSVRALAADDDRVLFPGYVYGRVLAELYSNAAAFVLPSALEGLPLTLLEAASYGVPLVASDIGPHAEVLGRDGPGRRLVPVGDELALGATLRRVLADQPAERAGAVATRADVLERYSWDRATDEVEAIYRALAATRRVPSQRRPWHAADVDSAHALRGGWQ